MSNNKQRHNDMVTISADHGKEDLARIRLKIEKRFKIKRPMFHSEEANGIYDKAVVHLVREKQCKERKGYYEEMVSFYQKEWRECVCDLDDQGIEESEKNIAGWEYEVTKETQKGVFHMKRFQKLADVASQKDREYLIKQQNTDNDQDKRLLSDDMQSNGMKDQNECFPRNALDIQELSVDHMQYRGDDLSIGKYL